MSSPMGRIRKEALRLEPKERARLASELIRSLDELDPSQQKSVDAEWDEEIRRRVQEVRERKADLLDGEEVLEELHRRFQE